MDTLDESWVERKLLTASNTQESVQSLSMWALHHKTQHERIVSIWFKVLKAAKIDLRLTLFYLCNEVVQTCRRRHAVVYKDAFKEVLRDAALLVRDISIRPNIERIFKIWAERGVYDAEFVNELLLLLNNTKVKNAMNTKLLADFSPRKLMDQLSVCNQLEEAVEEQREQLANIDVEALDGESFKQQLKDRHQGVEYADELAAACQQIQSYINNLETETRERMTLIELLEQSQLYYDAQSSEANMVAMAYKTFAGRIAVVQKKLSEMRKGTQQPSQDFEELSGGGKGESKELNDGLRPYQADTRHSSDDEQPEGFLDDNSPLPYITPMDYFDEPINDEDIFCTTSSSSKLFHPDSNFAGGGGSSSSTSAAAVLSDKRQSSVDLTYRLPSNEPGHRSRHTSTEHEHRRSPTTPPPSSHHRKSTDDLDQSSRNRSSRLDVDRDMMDLSDKIASFESTHRMLLIDDDVDADPLYDAALHHSFDKDASYHSNADTPHRRTSSGGGKQSSSTRRVSSESETSSHIRRRSASRGSVSPKLNSSFPPDSPTEQAHRSNCSSKVASGSTGTGGLYSVGQSGVSFLPTPHGVTSSSGASTMFSAGSGLSFIDTSVPPPPPPLTTTPGVDIFPDTSVPPPPLPAIFQQLLPSTNAAAYPPPGGVLSSLQPTATQQHVVQQHPLPATVQYIDPAAAIHQAPSRGHEQQAFPASTLYHNASVLVSDATAYPSDGLPSTGYSNEEGSGTPTRDEEGSSTPVLDEPEEDDFKYTFRIDTSNSVRNPPPPPPPPPPQQQQQQQMLLGPSSRTVVESNHHHQQQQHDRQRQRSTERQRKRNHSFSSDERPPHHASWDERRELSSSSSVKRERERSLSSYSSDDSIDDRRPVYRGDKRGSGGGHRDRSRDRDRRSSRNSEDRELYHRTSLEPLSSNSHGGTSSVVMITTDVDAHHHHHQLQQQHIYHHPPPHMPVAVHSQDVASIPLTYSTNVAPVASASTPDVIYGQQQPQSNSVVDLNSVTYLPVGSNGHNATSATVYQPHPVADFSVPPPTAAAAAVFNPSVPPPNLSLPPPSLAPVQQHAQTPHLLAAGAADQLHHHVPYQFPPSQHAPPPRIVQITVLPQPATLVEQSPVPTMTMFGATAAPPQSPLHGGAGGHMLSGPPPATRQMLAAPPRRIEYSQQPPPAVATQRQLSGEFETSSGRRRPYSNIAAKPCGGDNDAVSSSSSAAAAGTSPDILESKRRMIAISPSSESPPRRQSSSAGDTVLDAGGSSDVTLTTTVDGGGSASQQQQQIPTVVLSSDRFHRQQRHDGATPARYGRPGVINNSAGQRRNWL